MKEKRQPIHKRVDRLGERQIHREDKLDHFIIEVRSHFKKIEDELADHRRMFERLSND
ncbi:MULTISPECIES: hypothetical protein [Geobacillus]|uniref:Uncharacterized protein n=1 Tax=Geobacillus thermodenitrificans TaxID=33940 RepID=A0ABY9Q8N1_GEOTD|nr:MULTISPECIES: hypothetical protein [Geobacillus]MEC5187422.1 hypothetical protein [Geobacillus thermodenitrificans]MED3717063.1 hypothetical protein [Geobacillus thermodenitrificans]MED3906280.1 hypothetical protein [Geobacillus thermodenitrificans]MED4918968.1 hypothetical protein [Geobacillus thermodenitrificans]WMV75265.1 hypothetical protein HSX42_13440 [Geobacillus thermodenitrificans]